MVDFRLWTTSQAAIRLNLRDEEKRRTSISLVCISWDQSRIVLFQGKSLLGLAFIGTLGRYDLRPFSFDVTTCSDDRRANLLIHCAESLRMLAFYQ